MINRFMDLQIQLDRHRLQSEEKRSFQNKSKDVRCFQEIRNAERKCKSFNPNASTNAAEINKFPISQRWSSRKVKAIIQLRQEIVY